MAPRKAQAEEFIPTRREWNAAVKRQRNHMTEESIEIAYLVLMQRMSQADVAKSKKKSRTWVGNVVKRMIDDMRAFAGTSGWTTELVTLPPEDWAKVRAIEQAARARLAASRSSSRE